MKIKKLEAPSLRELFVNRMQHAILSGELTIGSRLPTERELAAGMGVSRQVINSGIEELQHRGFVNVLPRRGTYVADYRKLGNIETLNAIMEFSGDDIPEQIIRSILEVRFSAEHLNLSNAIENATEEDLKLLGSIVEKIKNSDNEDDAAEAAFRFQHTMAICGNNTVLPLLIVSFKNPILTLWKRFVRLYGTEILYQNTLKSYKHVCNRDYPSAKAWLETFMGEVINGKHQVYRI